MMSAEYREVVLDCRGAACCAQDGARHGDIERRRMGNKVRQLTQVFGVGAIHESPLSPSTLAAISDRRPAVGTPPLQSAALDLLPVGELSLPTAWLKPRPDGPTNAT